MYYTFVHDLFGVIMIHQHNAKNEQCFFASLNDKDFMHITFVKLSYHPPFVPVHMSSCATFVSFEFDRLSKGLLAAIVRCIIKLTQPEQLHLQFVLSTKVGTSTTHCCRDQNLRKPR